MHLALAAAFLDKASVRLTPPGRASQSIAGILLEKDRTSRKQGGES
jgi:hypothetical protein